MKPELSQELESLYRYLLVVAKNNLRGDESGFSPFGGMLPAREGPIALAKPAGIPGDNPEPIVARLVELFRPGVESGKYRAAGFCTHVRLEEGAPTRAAVRIGLEHQNGAALDVLVPFQRGNLGLIEFLEPQIQPGSPILFPKRAGA